MAAADTVPVGAEPPEAQLHRRLGLAGTTLSGVGIILGAGIYVIIGEAAGDAGSAVWVSFLIAAVLAGATGLSYAELASMFPEAGASSTYVREAFGRRAGFLVGWMRITIGVIGAAAVAIGFGGYADELLGAPDRATTAGLILLSGVVVVIGVRETVALAVAMTLAEVAGLVFVIVVGLPDVGSSSLLEAPDGLFGIVGGAALIFFAFEGFEQIATLSEETTNPTRTIPRAMLFSIVIATALYLLVAIVALSVVPWERLAGSDSPLADVVAAAAGERFADVLSTVALFATGNTVLLLLATAARMTYGMANRGLIPAVFRRVAPRRRTPWVAAATVTAAAAMVSMFGDIGLVAQTANFAVFGAFIAINATLIQLRLRRPELPRPFRIGWALRGVPVTAVVGGMGAAALALAMDGEALLGGTLALGAGLAVSFFALRHETTETA
jgi:APA family basic amino acid/polyamine antiporter